MRPYSAFSLAKTLLVAAVLFLGVFVVFPYFGRSRDHGNPSARECQSNLKHILLGVNQYLQDYDGKFPLLNARQLPKTVPASSGWVNSLQPYLRSHTIFQCPSESHSVLGLTDYAYNSPVLAARLARSLGNSSSTVIFCEADESDGFLASASAPLALNRHLEGANYALADGHVKWLQSTRAPAPSTVRTTGSNFTFGR